MTNIELYELEQALTKYHSEAQSALELSNIRPCLFMLRERLDLIEYSETKYMIDVWNTLHEKNRASELLAQKQITSLRYVNEEVGYVDQDEEYL